MRIRHKVPAIFSLSMVDMLCCALGCIILVWLLNAKQAKVAAARARAENEELRIQARGEREESRRLLGEAKVEYGRATQRVRDLNAKLTRLHETVADLRTQHGEETAKSKKYADQARQAGYRATELAKLVGEKDASLKGARSDMTKRDETIKGLQGQLADARQRERTDRDKAEQMGKTAAESSQQHKLTEAELKKTREERDKAKAVAVARGEELAAAGKRFAQVQQENRDLTAAAEARFAGIELTGQRVIFLVDMSGSMKEIASGVDAPLKWAEVCQTVERVMRSLPKLEKFQVIAFADKISHPLGGASGWLDADRNASPERARKALESLKPLGGTNMYAALDEAFRLRKDGLDTIYLLSDGLPNRGEGVPQAQLEKMTSFDKGVALGKHVRAKLKSDWNKPNGGKRVRIHTIGFFYESPDLGSFLWALARENDGSFVGMSRP